MGGKGSGRKGTLPDGSVVCHWHKGAGRNRPSWAREGSWYDGKCHHCVKAWDGRDTKYAPSAKMLHLQRAASEKLARIEERRETGFVRKCAWHKDGVPPEYQTEDKKWSWFEPGCRACQERWAFSGKDPSGAKTIKEIYIGDRENLIPFSNSAFRLILDRKRGTDPLGLRQRALDKKVVSELGCTCRGDER